MPCLVLFPIETDRIREILINQKILFRDGKPLLLAKTFLKDSVSQEEVEKIKQWVLKHKLPVATMMVERVSNRYLDKLRGKSERKKKVSMSDRKLGQIYLENDQRHYHSNSNFDCNLYSGDTPGPGRDNYNMINLFY